MAHQIKEELSKIDILINNAGVYNSSKSQNSDRLDMRFVVNATTTKILADR